MCSIAKNIHLSAVKHPTQKLFWPWFLPILAGGSYPAIAIGLLEHLNPEYHFEEEILVPSNITFRRLKVAEVKNYELSIFPNPAKDHLNVMYETDESNSFLQIIDATSRVVAFRELSGKKGDCVLNIEQLQSGVYVVQLLQNNTILATTRLIKTN